MDAMSGLCEEEASLIMCKSLTNMFIVCFLIYILIIILILII